MTAVDRPDQGSFSVCSVMHEPLFVVDRFVQHYIALGADTITILWDGLPEPDLKTALEALAPKNKLTLVYCDAAFWATLGIDKPLAALEDIQDAGFSYAYKACRSAWMLFCDADEFLHAPSPVDGLLARVPTDTPSLCIRNLEAVWGREDDITVPFGCSYFRAPIEIPRITRILVWVILGRYAVFSRGGLMGHYEGKHFLRTGLEDVSITIHFTRIKGHRVGEWAHRLSPPEADFFIAHYDGVSEERWVEKWRRRISAERIADQMSAPRARQQSLVQKAIEQGKTGKLFRRLYGLTRVQTTVLTRLGLITRARPIRDKA